MDHELLFVGSFANSARQVTESGELNEFDRVSASIAEVL